MATASAKTIDFSNVRDASGVNPMRIPSGDYLATVTKVEDAEAKDGTFQYLFIIKVKRFSQSAYPYYCKLQENQLWKLRNLFVAAGIAIPKGKVKLTPGKIVGRSIGVTIEDDEYEGKKKSVVQAVFPASELDIEGTAEDEHTPGVDDAEDDEMPTPARAVAQDDEEEDEEEATGDEFDDMDRTALKAYIKERNAEFKVLKSMSDDDLRDSARDLAGGPAADEEEEEEEEEAAPAPAPRRRAKAAAKVTDDELDELDIENL